MLTILITMLLIVLLAGAVVVYVAYPHRGEELPKAPWVGEKMRQGADKIPTIDAEREYERR